MGSYFKVVKVTWKFIAPKKLQIKVRKIWFYSQIYQIIFGNAAIELGQIYCSGDFV